MKKESDVLTLMRKQMGKDAAAILDRVDKMLKQRVSRARIEKAVAADLCAHLRKQMRLFIILNIPHRVCP